MIGNRFYTWFKNYYQWVGGAFNETLLLPLVRATQGLRAGAIRYDETTDTIETYDGTNWNAVPSASGFVPYTGATNDVDLGENGIEAGYVLLDTTPTGTPADQGTIYWDDAKSTAALVMNGTIQHIGQETYFHVKNSTGSAISKGTAVRFAGTDGGSGHVLIAPFIANGTFPSTYFMGVTSEAIGNGEFGQVVAFGKLEGINTNSFTDGAILYASTTQAGGFQTAVPTAPNNIVQVAAVVRAANNGKIIVRPTIGSNLNNDEGVLISGVTTNQGLFYDNGLWRNKSIATVLGYTPLNPTRQLTINGTAFDLSADRSWSVGTVTSVAASSPLSVSGSPSTTPIITISQANSTTNGYLSSTDWTTFNNKQAALNGTGFVKISGTTISYDNSTYYLASNPNAYIALTNLSAGTGISYNNTTGVITNTAPDQTISITASGTTSVSGTYPNFTISSADQFVGTVTSVGLTSATSGVTITDSPVTVSGTIGIAIATANASQQGLLSGTDWTTFNNKQNALTLTTTGSSGAATLVGATLNIPQYQAAGNYITSLTGEATASGPGAASVTLSTTAVTGKLLTGLNLAGGGTIASTDTILQAFGKVQNQISAMVGGVMYQGTWNASTNTPTLTSSVGVKGYYYIVDVSGTTNLNGITDWRVGDWAIFNGSTWDKVDNTDAVSSVNGFTGAVSLTTSHITEGTNLYYTDTRSRTAISLTTTGSSGAATYDNVSGIINVPQYTLAGLGGVPTTRSITINGTALDLSADRTYSVGTVTSVGLNSTTSGITITNTPVTSSGALTINIATASGSQNGLLSSTDWTTFNNKQNALNGTGFVKISGTTISYDNSTYLTTSAAAAAYVPYTGATTNVNLGNNTFTSSSVNVNGSGTAGGMLNIRQYSSSLSGTPNNTTLFVLNENLLGINFSQTGGNNKTIYFDVANLTNNISRTYQMPNAGGTLALTSDINSAISGTTNYLPKFTSANAIGNSQVFDNGTNVGINEATPSEGKLVINNPNGSTNNGSTGNSLYLKAQTANANLIRFSGAIATDLLIGRWGNADAISIGTTAGTEIARFTASGQLGLGVTPSAWQSFKGLQVGQVGSFASNDFGSGNIQTFIGQNTYYDNAGFKYIQSGTAAMMRMILGGEFQWHQTSTSGSANGAITFTQAMTLDASGNLSLRLATGATTNLFGFQNSSGTQIQRILYDDSDGSLTIGGGTSTGYPVKIFTGNTERMRITSGGNVLLGTTTDNGLKLQVSGDIFASNDIYLTNGNYVRLQRNSGNSYIDTLGIPAGTDDVNIITTGDFYIRNGSLQNLIKTTNGGNSEFLGSIKTGAPSGGTARAWKLGDVGTQALSQSRYVEVEINGTTYWLLATDVQV